MIRPVGLAALGLLLFLPLTLAADDPHAVLRQTLADHGWTLLYADDFPILLPDDRFAFEIRNLDRLRPGPATLDLHITYQDRPYADIRLSVTLQRQPDTPPPPATTTPAPKPPRQRILTPTPTPHPPSPALRPGRTVEIVYLAPGLVIRSEGRSLSAAEPGQTADALLTAFNTRVRGRFDGRRILIRHNEVTP